MCLQFFSSWEQFHVNFHLKCREKSIIIIKFNDLYFENINHLEWVYYYTCCKSSFEGTRSPLTTNKKKLLY